MRECVLCPLSGMIIISSLLVKTDEYWQFKILYLYSLSEYVRILESLRGDTLTDSHFLHLINPQNILGFADSSGLIMLLT